MGIIASAVDISGDGTCVDTGASHYGVKTCKYKDFKCSCPADFLPPTLLGVGTAIIRATFMVIRDIFLELQ